MFVLVLVVVLLYFVLGFRFWISGGIVALFLQVLFNFIALARLFDSV